MSDPLLVRTHNDFLRLAYYSAFHTKTPQTVYREKARYISKNRHYSSSKTSQAQSGTRLGYTECSSIADKTNTSDRGIVSPNDNQTSTHIIKLQKTSIADDKESKQSTQFTVPKAQTSKSFAKQAGNLDSNETSYQLFDVNPLKVYKNICFNDKNENTSIQSSSIDVIEQLPLKDTINSDITVSERPEFCIKKYYNVSSESLLQEAYENFDDAINFSLSYGNIHQFFRQKPAHHIISDSDYEYSNSSHTSNDHDTQTDQSNTYQSYISLFDTLTKTNTPGIHDTNDLTDTNSYSDNDSQSNNTPINVNHNAFNNAHTKLEKTNVSDKVFEQLQLKPNIDLYATKIQSLCRSYLCKKLLDIVVLSKTILQARNYAACKVQALVKSYMCRRILKEEWVNQIISWPEKECGHDTVFIIGNFTTPEWTVAIPTKRCPFRKCLYAYVKRSKTTTLRFLFLVNNKVIVNPNYKLVLTSSLMNELPMYKNDAPEPYSRIRANIEKIMKKDKSQALLAKSNSADTSLVRCQRRSFSFLYAV